MVTVGEILQRPAIELFMTVHVKGEVEGEVEPEFFKQYGHELGDFWLLLDSDGLKLRVGFNRDDDVPRITTGWMNLRSHYKFEGHHEILFKYLGTNFFQVIPKFENITPDKFPTWHTKTRALRKAVSFTMTITEDPEVDPELILPTDMGAYLADVGLDEVNIVATNGEKHKCELAFQKYPFMVKIKKGWPECVGISRFRIGDHIQFNAYDIYKHHAITVQRVG